jgi:hypothetical protein
LTEVNTATAARAAMVPSPARKTKMMMAIQPTVVGRVRGRFERQTWRRKDSVIGVKRRDRGCRSA